MKRRETLRSFFHRNAAWRLQRHLTSEPDTAHERQKETMIKLLEKYDRFQAVSI